MKKLLLTTAITSLFATNAIATDNKPVEDSRIENQGWYVFGGTVSQDSDLLDSLYIDDELDGFIMGIGYDVNENIGTSIRLVKTDLDYISVGGKATIENQSLGFYADFGKDFVVNDDFRIKPYVIAGLELMDYSIENSYARLEDDDTALMLGFGVRTTIAHHLSVSAELSRSKPSDFDIDSVILMAGYKF